MANGIFASRINRKLPAHQVFRQDVVETRSKHLKMVPKNQTNSILKTCSSLRGVRATLSELDFKGDTAIKNSQ